MTNLHTLFTTRAALAFTLGQAERDGKPVPPGVLRRYRITQRKLDTAQQGQSNVVRQAPPAPLVPDWCSLCGSATREKLVGHLMCVVCEAERTREEATIHHKKVGPHAVAVDYLTPETEL